MAARISWALKPPRLASAFGKYRSPAWVAGERGQPAAHACSTRSNIRRSIWRLRARSVRLSGGALATSTPLCHSNGISSPGRTWLLLISFKVASSPSDSSFNTDRAAKTHAVRSSSVYGNNQKVPFAETDPVDEPISPYAATKRAGELICHTYCHLFGMSIACLRLFTVFGPGQRPDLAISKFMRLMADDRPVPMFGDGTSSRDYTYVADIVSGCLAAQARLGTEPEGYYRIWNLGGSHPITLRDMIDSIAKVVGKTADIDTQPPLPGDVRRTWADLARSKSELGYEPTVSFEEGLRRQWEWMSPLVSASSSR